MSYQSTLRWFIVALVLFACIFGYERYIKKPPAGPARILPELVPADVSIVQVRPPKGSEIRAVRTNGGWALTEPLVYPADAAPVTRLLTSLAQLTPSTFLTEVELHTRPNSDEQYGFSSPQASLIITQGNYWAYLLFGIKTAPGDQVFLKVVAREGAYVVDADVLKWLPHSGEDWRERDLLHSDQLAFDRLALTNNLKSLVLRRASTNGLWQMVWPLSEARADSDRIDEALQKLQTLRVEQFVSDDPKADLEAYGLQTPDLELALGQGTNTLALLQVGKSPTNHADQLYARRLGQTAIVTLPKESLNAWRIASVNDFRDPHLLELTTAVDLIEAHGRNDFTLSRDTNGLWRVLPAGFPANGEQITNLLAALGNMSIVQFTKDVATPLNWPEFGLANPARQYVLRGALTNSGAALTNPIIADLSFGFGTNQFDKVFVRRADEAPVYAVSTNDFAALPSASWEMRDRHFWDFSEKDLSGLIVQQRGQVRQLVRRGDHDWSLAPGSQGIIEGAAIEESVHNVLAAPALDWIAVGETNRAHYGFSNDEYRLSFLLKDGRKQVLEFGGESPSGSRYAAVTLDKELWIMEFPWSLYRYVSAYLSIPAP